jgi:hypothetical protein
LGYVYGGITVVSFTDKEGNITSQDGCGQAPPVADCECDGGIISITFAYDSTMPTVTSDDPDATVTYGTGTVTLTSNNGDKLSNPDIFVNGVNEGEAHASCSQNLLGKMYGVLTVISYIDQEGGEISLENCPADPVECDCSGGLESITLVYLGSGSLSTNSGDISPIDSNGIFTISTSDKLEKDLVISLDGAVVAVIHTSCSDDILGNVNATKSTFGDSGSFPDPEGNNDSTFYVISHTDTNGNVCSIDYTPSFRTSMRTMEDVKPEVITEFSVKAWPNPADNQFNIRVLSPELKDKVNLEVIDMRGRVIHKDQFNTGYDYTFGDDFNAGLYFVRIQQGDSVETIKLMKR